MGFRTIPLLGLLLLMGCRVMLDVREAGLTGPTPICTRLQETHGTASYCGFAATLTDVTQSGSGSESDPYILCSPYQVNAIGTDATLVTKSYKLGADIDMSCISGNHTMIGSQATPFTGNFDGDNKTISNWTYIDATIDYVGFFGGLAGGGLNIVKDLAFTSAQVTGKNYVGILSGNAGALLSGIRTAGSVTGTNYVGGIAGVFAVGVQTSSSSATVSGASYVGGLTGYMLHAEVASCSFSGSVSATGLYAGGLVGDSGSTIHNSYNTGTVSSTSTHVGGLVGRSSYGVENSFNTGNVTGVTSVGGLVGELRVVTPVSAVINSFSTGNVSGSGGTSTNVGFLIGTNAGAATNSYYLATASCDADALTAGTQACGTTATGTVASLSDFYDATLAPLSSWDFQGNSSDGTNDFWEERTGALPVTWNEAPEAFVPAMSGSGTDDDPYLITSVAEFNLIGRNHRYTGASFRLMSNLDFTATTFQEIGAGEGPFYGNFDGNGMTLSNITLAKTRTYAGVFGLSLGDVYDLTISNANISTTRVFAGLLSGWHYGTIRNCQTSGQATGGTFYTAGVVGILFGSITDSSSSATVVGTSSAAVGGLVGALSGDVTRSFATGTVTGTSGVGGLVGRFVSGSVSDSYATGAVNSGTGSNQNYGGLVGVMFANTSISRSYATGNVAGRNSTGGLVGSVNATGTSITNCFSTGNVTGSTNSATVGRLVGTSTASVTNSYYLATSTCDANTSTAGIQACNTTSTGSAAALSDFYSIATVPLDQWDFITIWDSDAASLPVLR